MRKTPVAAIVPAAAPQPSGSNRQPVAGTEYIKFKGSLLRSTLPQVANTKHTTRRRLLSRRTLRLTLQGHSYHLPRAARTDSLVPLHSFGRYTATGTKSTWPKESLRPRPLDNVDIPPFVLLDIDNHNQQITRNLDSGHIAQALVL